MAFRAKYDDDYAEIREFAKTDPDLPIRPVDLGQFGPLNTKEKISGLATKIVVPTLIPILRFWPSVKLFGLHWITREKEVRAVLSEHDAFNSPFGLEMAHLTNAATFCLGDDGALHQRQRDALEVAWKGIEDERHVRAPARKFAQALLDDSGGEVDVVGELIRQVVARVAEQLLGCKIDDHAAFSTNVIAIATFLFADPYGTRRARTEGLLAARSLKPIVEDVLQRAMEGKDSPSTEFDGIIPGMARALQSYLETGADPDYDEVALRNDLEANAYGMTTAFAVTHAFTAGVLSTFGKRQEQWRKAVELAKAITAARAAGENDATLVSQFDRMMMEASRFTPAIYPGSFRVRTAAQMNTASEHKKLNAIPKGETLMVCTASAVHDPRCKMDQCRDPKRFDPDRFDPDALHSALAFGYGHHNCIGALQAISIASETLIALFAKQGIRFADKRPKVGMIGPIHASFKMRFDPTLGALEQCQIIAALPLRQRHSHEDAITKLAQLQENGALFDVFKASGIVHFASFNVVKLGKRGKETSHLLAEFNVDGPRDAALERLKQIAQENPDAAQDFAQLAELVLEDPVPPANASTDLFSRIGENAVELTESPFGHTGAHFVGSGEFSVKQIEQERALASFVNDHIARSHPPQSATQDEASALYHSAKTAAIEAGFGDLMFRLPGRGPGFARTKYITFQAYLLRYATQPIYLRIALGYVALTLVGLISVLWAGWAGLVTYLVLALVPVLLSLSCLGGLFVWLRRKERAEQPDPRRVNIDTLRRTRALEERRGYAQTHITSVSDFKLGLFRRLTFSLAMHIIVSFVRLWFRPGFLTDFATIHYARWFRLKGTDQLVFQSNYDGSWESYLEDFVTKVHNGQTLAWNNAEGFPRSNFLWRDGARDGDRFKRWVRNQQIETPFWYSHYPELTLPQIHMNALVRDGLARARDVSDHRDWLKLFSSMPNTGHHLEGDQIQSIVFHGHAKHEAAACIPLRFEDGAKARAWLGTLVRDAHNTTSAEDAAERTGAAGGGFNAAELVAPTLSFGDGEPRPAAYFLALSARGLAKLNVPTEAQTGLNAFPGPFLDGMRARGATLDDPETIAWSDAGWSPSQQDDSDAAEPGHTGFDADAVLLLYMRLRPDFIASNSEAMDAPPIWEIEDFKSIYSSLQQALGAHAVTAGDGIDLSRRRGRSASLGGFGFHEGASQPLIEGTRAAAKPGALAQDILAPGEFLLGYKDLRGFIPPEIAVRSDLAARACLPLAKTPRRAPYPHFGDPDTGHIHDFGRNGSFLVIRQLEHLRDPDGADVFDSFVCRSARQMAARISEQPLSQAQKTYAANTLFLEDLVRAKMLGRWRDGSSLVRNPLMSATARLRKQSYGELLAGPAGILVLAAHERLLRRDMAVPDDAPLPHGALDRMLWEDPIWDFFVAETRRSIMADNGQTITPEDAQRVLLHPWLKPQVEWPQFVDNDFNFGLDDPQGLACPIGSHVRRSNPRDTPNPDNPDQLMINNRHRLLRRGRPYRGTSSSAIEGTHFMCLNADIERQFEFVQRTWLNAQHFQGLVDQPDPIAAPHGAKDRFVIPHTTHFSELKYRDETSPENLADITRLVGGGYFFLPSKATLAYLAHPALDQA